MNFDRGAIWIADVNGGRRRCLVLSNSVFGRRYQRALIAPDAKADLDEPRRPGWVGSQGAYFDVTRVVAVALDRLLEFDSSAPPAAVSTARRILDEALR